MSKRFPEFFGVSGYAFNGDFHETEGENHIEHFGIDAHYNFTGDRDWEIMVGASYISNISDSDGLTGELQDLGVNSIRDYVGGFDSYLHIGYDNFFFDAEYMTATEDFEPAELATWRGDGAQPAVWNLEAGYNWDWGKNLEIAFKYAGSDESENLGFPEDRYGLALNQTIWDGVIVSLAYLHDEFEINDRDGRNERDVVLGQLAIEF